MGVFNRIFKIGQSEANAVIDKFEDPVKMTEQGIRDLKNDLGGAIEALASAKSNAIRARKDYDEYSRQAREYATSAERLLSDPTKQVLAQRAVDEAKRIGRTLPALKIATETQEKNVSAMDTKIDSLRSTISQYERELVTLKARAKTAEATKKINKQLAQVDSSSTIAMLERMKERVAEDEASAQAYGEIADQTMGAKSLEEEIRRALPLPSEVPGSNLADEIAALKAQLN
jgi:phage shock protein A